MIEGSFINVPLSSSVAIQTRRYLGPSIICLKPEVNFSLEPDGICIISGKFHNFVYHGLLFVCGYLLDRCFQTPVISALIRFDKRLACLDICKLIFAYANDLSVMNI